MSQNQCKPNISFRVDPEFQKQIDDIAKEHDMPRSELLRKLVYNVLNYESSNIPFKTVNVGKLKEMIEFLPDELPLIAYTSEGEDYAINGLSLFSMIGGLKLESLNKQVPKPSWELEDLIKE